MDIDARIKAIEDFVKAPIPGTMITRTAMPPPAKGYGWCLAIGCMGMPKDFFHAVTIEECLTMVEDMLQIPKPLMKPVKGLNLQDQVNQLTKKVGEVESDLASLVFSYNRHGHGTGNE